MYKSKITIHNNTGDNMEDKLYTEIVDKHKPRENRILNLILSFFIGGIIGLLGEYITQLYSYYFNIPIKDAASFTLVTFIFIACLFTALGFFDKLVSIFRCGLIIPITGFAHSMMSAGMEYRKEGLVTGIGSNAFKLAGSVILYGVVAAWFFGTIRYILRVM